MVPLWPRLKNDLQHHGWESGSLGPKSTSQGPWSRQKLLPGKRTGQGQVLQDLIGLTSLNNVGHAGEMRRGAKTKHTQFHDGFW